MKRLPGLIYLVSGLYLTVMLWSIVAWAVWGAPVGRVIPAFFGAMILTISGIVDFFHPQSARWLASAGLLLVSTALIQVSGVFVAPGDVHGALAWVVAYLSFLAALWTAVHTPTRLRYRRWIMALSLFAPIAFGAWRHHQLSDFGAYDEPQLIYLDYTPAEKLTFQNLHDVQLEQKLREGFLGCGITGDFTFMGSQSGSNPKSLLVIAAGTRPTADRDFHFPQGSFGLYLFDGREWKTYPNDLKVYTGYAKAQTVYDSSRKCDVTWIYLNHGTGGSSGTPAFYWTHPRN